MMLYIVVLYSQSGSHTVNMYTFTMYSEKTEGKLSLSFSMDYLLGNYPPKNIFFLVLMKMEHYSAWFS